MHLVVILANLRSAHNVGAIFRTADALAVEKIYLCGTTPCPTQSGKAGRELAKTALGAERCVAWEYRGRVGNVLRSLKRQGFQILALEQDKKALDLRKYHLPRNKQLALVLGYEVAGIPQRILRQCDKIIEIPMFGQKESLNVAVAFGIAGYSLKFSDENFRKSKALIPKSQINSNDLNSK